MAGTPTFATSPFFLGTEQRDRDARFVIAGVPLDIGTTNRSGARLGPQSIRHASRMPVDGAHPQHWIDPLGLTPTDAGDFTIALGGEHGITLSLLRALAKRLGHAPGLVRFDAHLDRWPDDTCPDNSGQLFGHGSVFHAIEEGIVDPAAAPGTGTPEIGGLAWWQAQAILRRLGGLRWVGLDVVEVAPAYDASEITALAGASSA